MNSGLIVVLPLIGAVVGAFVGAWANSWYRDREAKKARATELGALIVLVDVEIWSNDAWMKVCIEQGSFDQSALASLKREDWDATKVRLSELLTDIAHLDTLSTYYEILRTIQTEARIYGDDFISNRNFFVTRASRLIDARRLGSTARQDNSKYLPEARYAMFAIPDPEAPVKD